MKPLVSIVIIGRNEEAGLASCLLAANTAAAEVSACEVIYVDSNSTDRSVEIARTHGARVVDLPADVRRCPSAGRFIGSQNASGEFILFLDADTHIYCGFLPTAIAHLQTNPILAGVNGRIDDLDEVGTLLEDVEARHDLPTETKWLRGPACFYRRSPLMAVGSFDPNLAMEEEAELGLRLRSKGFGLELIPVRMACHTRCYHCQSFGSVIDTFRRDVETGRLGEITRTISAAFSRGYGIEFCWLRLQTTILLVSWLGIAILSLLIPNSFLQLSMFLGILAFGSIAIILKKQSVKHALIFVANKLIIIVDVLFGLPKIFFPKAGSNVLIEGTE